MNAPVQPVPQAPHRKYGLFLRLLHRPATAWVILFVSFILTAAAWYIADKSIRRLAQDRFTAQAKDLKTAIQQRMLEYESTLRGGVGLFKVSNNVSRQDWRAYTENLELKHYYPGIQGFGYSVIVRPEERVRHELSIRAEGFPEYHIKPEGERDLYSAIIYLEPFDVRNRRAFGYDMYSNPVRHEAMDRARDTGRVAVSGRVTLVQEMDTDIQHGFLMYFPLYRKDMPVDTVEQRRAALQGYVYAPFRMNDLMRGILSSSQTDIDFELYDGPLPSADTALYQSNDGPLHYGNAAFDKDFDDLSQIKPGGHTWSLYLYARPGFISTSEASQPLVVGIGGVLIDLLLFFIILSISQRQRQAEVIAREMTEDLRRSNMDLEQFAYAASHDMRQPLRMISSYLQLLEADLQQQLNDTTRQELHFAIDGARRMDEMLLALLDYSRVGRRTEAMSMIDTRAVLDEALRYLQPDAKEHHASIRIEGAWPRHLASRDELLRLLQNLIGNAIKYHPEGRAPEIVINSARSDLAWHFSVHDNGVGLRPGQETRLFKIFERLHSRERYPGTGIGLATCRKIVEHHGGRIWAESAGENQGCTFHVTLPVKPPREAWAERHAGKGDREKS